MGKGFNRVFLAKPAHIQLECNPVQVVPLHTFCHLSYSKVQPQPHTGVSGKEIIDFKPLLVCQRTQLDMFSKDYDILKPSTRVYLNWRNAFSWILLLTQIKLYCTEYICTTLLNIFGHTERHLPVTVAESRFLLNMS